MVRTRAEKGRDPAAGDEVRAGHGVADRLPVAGQERTCTRLDAALNLPEEKHSHGLRKLAAIEAARGSMEAAGAAITRATGVRHRETAAGGAGSAGPPPTWTAFYLWRVISAGAGRSRRWC